MRLALVTCMNVPKWEMDDVAFHQVLKEAGVDFEIVAWDDPKMSPQDWAKFQACLIRTTWDYDQHLEAFLAWVDQISQQTQLINPPEIISWNSRKSYLKDLAQQGVPIAETFWVNQATEILQIVDQHPETHFFLKPEVGACARNTKRFHKNEVATVQEWLQSQNQTMLLQPYLKRVETEGEYSAIYFGGQLSHCVQKIPVSGDYRVQDDYGASDFAIEVIPELQQLSEMVLALLPPLLYARIDALRLEDGTWVLNELELIEPSLFFRHSQTAPKLLLEHLQAFLLNHQESLFNPSLNSHGFNHHVESLVSEKYSNTLQPSTHFRSPQMSIDFTDPSLYFNRELSTLAFNRRVLALSTNDTIPLLERLRFLSIVSSNLDEFFEVRVAGVRQRDVLDLSLRGLDALTPRQLLQEIRQQALELVSEQYRILNDILLPELSKEGISLLRRAQWNHAQQEWIKEYFQTQVFPVLTPIGLDPAHPFPNVQNKSLNFILSLKGKDAFGRESNLAILPVPRCLPRIIELPPEMSDGSCYVLLSSIIHAHSHELFPGMKVTGCYQFRVTRDADMWVDEEEIDDLMTALKGQLHGRHFGDSVRIEIADNCPGKLAMFLCEQHHLTESELYQVNGLVNLHRLGFWVNLIDRPDLKFAPYSPGVPKKLTPNSDIFHLLGKEKEDILLHHPYRSFDPVVGLVWAAAKDPSVLAIKMTLYRVGSNSPLVDALIEAARMNTDVTVVVELRARFDEAENISLAQRLIQAGAKVAYGIVNYKCHAKLMLLVRREGKKLKRYAHIGTGNYHVSNARLYTDYSLMTTNAKITEDVHKIFMQLTGLGKVTQLQKVLQSPFTLLSSLRSWIALETAKAKKGKEAWIIAKMNSLTEPEIIQDLYVASQAGVQIRLIIRGICVLRPGIPGISENIQVRSIVGRFLEHHRVYAFSVSGVFIASADWMTRNLRHRVEVCCPISDEELQERLLYELNEVFWRDNTRSWQMYPDGTYQLVQDDQPPFCAHDFLVQDLGDKTQTKQ